MAITMSRAARIFLRASIGYLLVIWGADKLVDPAHGISVSDWIYFGWFSQRWIMHAFGAIEVGLGVLVIAGLWTRISYPLVAVITGATLLGVWRSIVDPWGWYLDGTNALFYPSLIIFAAVLLLMSEDRTPSPARPPGQPPVPASERTMGERS